LGRYAADVMIRVLLVYIVENYELELFDGEKREEEKRDI
jgi:hypothetical protein